MKVVIIGYGNMGKTYANSFVSSRFIKPSDIYAYVKESNVVLNSDVIPKENFIVIPNEKLSEFDIIILSVKPQDFLNVAKQIKPFIKNNQLILSVMAGVTIEAISTDLGCSKIVRSMPNIPAQIGQGMTVFSASSTVDRKELFILQNLINTTGKSIYVEDENLINAATAISGTGPAYVFYFMQSIIEAAIQLGFNESEAELLVNQTFRGSVSIQNSANLSNTEWIKKVASKGGTTESALNVFKNKSLEGIIVEGILAANQRAKELGS